MPSSLPITPSMGNGVGRISGPLLKDNLLRNGVDLSFDTDLLYLNVNDNRIGIKTDSPSRDLEVDNTIKTTNLIVDNLISLPNLEIDTTGIRTNVGELYIDAGSSIRLSAAAVDDLVIDNNLIKSKLLNSSVEIRPTKGTIFNSNTFVQGSVHSTGDITFDGTITFGDSDLDNVSFAADIKSSLLPDVANGTTLSDYALGTSTRLWNRLYTKALTSSRIVANTLTTPANINYTLRYSNSWFVSTTGSDLNQGNHPNGQFNTISKALSVATAGDTIFVYAGVYTEVFPLVVPAGVSVVGQSLRSTTIQPTFLTDSQDAFLLNGETTISNLTVRNFYYDSVADTGYAFRFAPNFTVTSKSPYIQNVSVITHGSSLAGNIDGGDANDIILEILDGGNAFTASFGNTAVGGQALIVEDPDDPLGFADGDAGKGALVDGAVANASSLEASMLFHAVTFITPGVDAITMRNGVRVEWLDGFTYFANRGLYATDGATGFNGKFGAEIRSIGSANVYGNYGAVADGASTLMYLINHNFGYIGSGKDKSNDSTLSIRANEVVEINSGKIYYQSQSEIGDFRIGDAFLVDFSNGNVSFDIVGIAANGLSSLAIQGVNSSTFIDASKIETGDFRLAGNTIQTLTSPINIQASNGITNLNQDVYAYSNVIVSGNFTTKGTLTFGNQSQDTITFNTDISQSIIPRINDTYDLGSLATSKIWNDVYSYTVNTAGTTFSGTSVSARSLDGSIEFLGSGTGNVTVESLTFNNNTITTSSNNNLLVSASSNNVVFFGTSAVRIPRNTTALTTRNQLRFNTSNNLFEGFTTDTVSFGGLRSKDTLTSIVIGPTDNTIGFRVQGNVNTTITSTGFNTLALNVGDLLINNNTLNSNSTLTLNASDLLVQDLTLSNSEIIAPLDSNLEFSTLGTGGYVAFTGTNAIEIPSGDVASRPANPIIGNTRFNQELNIVEIFDGEAWISVAGNAANNATIEEADDVTSIWALILG